LSKVDIYTRIITEGSPIESSAELFSLLGHQVRISIIKVVHEEGPISFSGLMKALNIESSSLGFHLKKLEACLVRDENGNYGLTERGKMALRVLSPLNIVSLKQDKKKGIGESWKTPDKLRWFVQRVLGGAPQPGNWGIGIGVFVAFIGLIMFAWNPTYSLIVIATGIAAVCVGIWANLEETKTVLEFVKERDKT